MTVVGRVNQGIVWIGITLFSAVFMIIKKEFLSLIQNGQILLSSVWDANV